MTVKDFIITRMLNKHKQEYEKITKCNHSFDKFGFGYKCENCGYYTGLFTELNELIEKEKGITKCVNV